MSALQALGFLTPLGGSRRPTPGALGWFAAVGAVLGAVLGGLWWLCGRAWPAAVAAAIVVAADLALTGLLHLDGLVDTADGLLAHLSTARRLEVMAEPGIGAFGAGVAIAILFLRWAALTAISPSLLLLAGLWCASRTLMATTVLVVPYARPGGLASAFLDSAMTNGGRSHPARIALVAAPGAAAALALVLAWDPLPGGMALGASLVAGSAVVAFARIRVGGFTGDVLGAAGVVAETIGLVVAAASW